MSKPRLSKSAIQLREQIDDSFPDRDRASDGWIADARHVRSGKPSDHIPNEGWVRAIDIDADLNKSKGTSVYLADQIRECAKSDRRISYVIHMGKICSRKSFWRWVKYTGFNKHTAHIHVSFTKDADQDSKFFNIPMLGGSNG
jgi:hypothetical protein